MNGSKTKHMTAHSRATSRDGQGRREFNDAEPSLARSKSQHRTGITLLEIVLALALAAIAMSLLAQLVSLGNAAAIASRDSSKAQIIAESIMAEVVSGVLPPTSASGTWDLDPLWSYEISVGIGPSPTINAIRVSVTQNVDTRPMSFSLTQWLAIPPEVEEETIDSEAGAL